MWIYNRCMSLGSGIFNAKIKDLKFVVEMPSGKVLSKFNDKQVAFIKLNPSLFTWIDEPKSEEPQVKIEEPIIQFEQESLEYPIVEEQLLIDVAPKKTKKSVGKK